MIHAVGPVWEGGSQGEDGLLASCFRSALGLARDHRLGSIAFPAISCGVYGYPLADAVAIAVREVRGAAATDPMLERVVFACFGSAVRDAYERALAGADKRDRRT